MHLLAVDFNEILTYVLRGGAALIGFLVGWFVTAPIAGVLSRLAFQRPVAPKVLPWVRLAGALGLAALLYFIVSKWGPGGGGGGGDGGGFGPGSGPGKEKGKEGGSRDRSDPKEGRDGKEKDRSAKDKDITTPPTDLIEVEILGDGGADGRWFFVGGKALTSKELRAHVEKHLEEKKLKAEDKKPTRVQLRVHVTLASDPFWETRVDPNIRELARELGLLLEYDVAKLKEK